MTATHRALRHHFTIGGNRDGRALLGSLVRSLEVSTNDRPEASYELHVEGELASAYLDGRQILSAPAGDAASRLVTMINTRATESVPNHDVVHAAAVSFQDGAIVVPANAGQGKSTMCAALVAAGFGYLSDELAPIADDLTVMPYPKPIVVGRGSFDVLPDLANCDIAAGVFERWFLDPERIRPESAESEPLAVLHVVVPSFEPGAKVNLRLLSPGEIAAALIANSFNIRSRQRAGVDRLAALAREIRGYEIVHGDAREAAAALNQRLKSDGD